jgi:hypothetical protein
LPNAIKSLLIFEVIEFLLIEKTFGDLKDVRIDDDPLLFSLGLLIVLVLEFKSEHLFNFLFEVGSHPLHSDLVVFSDNSHFCFDFELTSSLEFLLDDGKIEEVGVWVFFLDGLSELTGLAKLLEAVLKPSFIEKAASFENKWLDVLGTNPHTLLQSHHSFIILFIFVVTFGQPFVYLSVILTLRETLFVPPGCAIIVLIVVIAVRNAHLGVEVVRFELKAFFVPLDRLLVLFFVVISVAHSVVGTWLFSVNFY